MFKRFVYENSFDGFLTAIYDCFYAKDKPEAIVTEEECELSLMYEDVFVEEDTVKSHKVASAIASKISDETLDNLYYLFLSNDKARGMLAYNYLKLGFKYGSKINLILTNDCVLAVSKLKKRVKEEAHIMLGFVRFQDVGGLAAKSGVSGGRDGVVGVGVGVRNEKGYEQANVVGEVLNEGGNGYYYATIEPDNDVLPLIAPHFASRFADQNFIIHDLKRQCAIFYNLEEWVIGPLPKEKQLKSNCEDMYASLWKDYFQAIAIKNRTNKKLQDSHVRSRYRKHLTEFQ